MGLYRVNAMFTLPLTHRFSCSPMHSGTHSAAMQTGLSPVFKRCGKANPIGSLMCFREHTLSP